MPCVTPSEVKAIMKTNSLTDAQIEPYINTANRYITAVFAGDTTTSADTKKDLEKWFTAHLIASIRMRTRSEEKITEATIRYADKFGTGLDSTPYGQMVKQLDITGKVANGGKRMASIYAIKSFE